MGISAGLGYYRITDPAMGLCNSSSLNVIMVPGGNTGQSEQHIQSYTKAHRHHHNHRWYLGPRAQLSLLVATWVPCCGRTRNMNVGNNLGPDVIWTSSDKQATGASLFLTTFVSSVLPRFTAWTVLLLFLFHVSTIHLLNTMAPTNLALQRL